MPVLNGGTKVGVDGTESEGEYNHQIAEGTKIVPTVIQSELGNVLIFALSILKSGRWSTSGFSIS